MFSSDNSRGWSVTIIIYVFIVLQTLSRSRVIDIEIIALLTTTLVKIIVEGRL